MVLDDSSIPTLPNLCVKLFLLTSQLISRILTKVLLVGLNKLLKGLESLTVSDFIVDLEASGCDLGAHRSEKCVCLVN